MLFDRPQPAAAPGTTGTAAADPPTLALHCHSSEEMPELPDESVALTVTSPPYWNAIDYRTHANGAARAWYRTRRREAGYDDYLDLMQRVFAETFRVTRPGGFCAVVIGTILMNGEHIPAPFDLTARLMAEGWLFHEDIIWHKTTAGVRRAGSVIQKPYPGYYYPNIMTEYILVFRKEGERIYRRDPAEREDSRFPIDDVFLRDVANNVWHIAPVPPRHIDHPCPFPEEIPHRLAQLYSYAGETVLDPFAGAGQTPKAALRLGRNAVGYDIEPKYIALAERRCREPGGLREQQLVANFGKAKMARPIDRRFAPEPNGNGAGDVYG